MTCTFDSSDQQDTDGGRGEVGLIHHGTLGDLGSRRLRELGDSLSDAEGHSLPRTALLPHPSLDEGPSREEGTKFCSNPQLQIYLISSQ